MGKKLAYDKTAFNIRPPKMKLWHMVIIGTLVAAAILTSINSSNIIIEDGMTILLTLAIIALLYIQQNWGADNRTASEFQSLVFSGAMRVNTLLTLVLYRDGSVFYMDPRYMTNFTQGSPHHNLDQFLTTIGLENANKIYVYDAIRDLTRAEFEYVHKMGRKSSPVKIGIYPLQRPEGFITLNIIDK